MIYGTYMYLENRLRFPFELAYHRKMYDGQEVTICMGPTDSFETAVRVENPSFQPQRSRHSPVSGSYRTDEIGCINNIVQISSLLNKKLKSNWSQSFYRQLAQFLEHFIYGLLCQHNALPSHK